MSAAPAVSERGNALWLAAPLLYGNALTAVAAAAYAYVAVSGVEGPGRTFAAMGASVVLFAAWMVASAQLRTVRELAGGDVKVSPAQRIEAILEVRRLPDRLRTVTWVAWLAGAAVLAVILPSAAELSLGGRLRVAAMGLAFGPMAAGLVRLLVVRRARAFIERAGMELPVSDVVSTLKSQGKRSVRTQLVALTAVMVILPAVLVADASRAQSRAALQRVAQAPREHQAEVAQLATQHATAKVLALTAILVALALGAAALTGTGLAEPLRHVADEANRISRGDLREVRIVAAEDELWVVTSTFAQLQAQLQAVVAQMQRAGVSIGSTTEELMATSSKYESGASDQATSLNETSATTEELAQSARQISQNASNVSELAQKTLDAARAGQASAQAFVDAVERMKHDNYSIAEAVTWLQKRVQQIGRIVEFITTVADRSDLLALSAELEGTKAGDVGRGFTLVAAEMRRLAENVIESTNEIEELIGEIREATQATVAATNLGLEHTESGTSLAGAVSQSLGEVVGLAQGTHDSVRAISLATQQQQTSTDQLAEAMADILGITQQSLTATKQVTSANHELINLSGDLKALVERFQVRKA